MAPMNAQKLIDTAEALVAGDKGRLAIPQTGETRRAYLDMTER
jgi:hypothetical protein